MSDFRRAHRSDAEVAGQEGAHYDEYRIGGTSLSAPLLAGIVALPDDLQGHPDGFINPSLYSRVRTHNGVHDVERAEGAVVRVDYNNGVDEAGHDHHARSFDFPQTITTTAGYDRSQDWSARGSRS